MHALKSHLHNIKDVKTLMTETEAVVNTRPGITRLSQAVTHVRNERMAVFQCDQSISCPHMLNFQGNIPKHVLINTYFKI